MLDPKRNVMQAVVGHGNDVAVCIVLADEQQVRGITESQRTDLNFATLNMGMRDGLARL